MTSKQKDSSSVIKVIRDNDHCMIIGTLVRGIRNAIGISQIDLAQLLGVSRSTVLKLEQGRPPLKLALCQSAMEVFEEAGVQSLAMRDVILIGAGYPISIDFSIEFQHLRHLRHVLLKNPNSSGIGQLMLGDKFNPPHKTNPLRKSKLKIDTS